MKEVSSQLCKTCTNSRLIHNPYYDGKTRLYCKHGLMPVNGNCKHKEREPGIES